MQNYKHRLSRILCKVILYICSSKQLSMSSVTFASIVMLSVSSNLFHSILNYCNTVSVLAMTSILVMEHKEIKCCIMSHTLNFYQVLQPDNMLSSYLTRFQFLTCKEINLNGWFNTICRILSDLYCINFTKSYLTLQPLTKTDTDL